MHHQKKNHKVQGAVPCGNPKRYGSRDVVHMPALGPHDRKRKSGHDGDDNATESEKHIQTLLNRQIKTDLSLTEQFSQHRSFSLATSHDPEVEKLIGVRSLDKYQTVNDLDARIDYLRHCGLDDAEITFKLKDEFKDKVTVIPTGYGGDPDSKLQKLQNIERKIREKEESLKVPDTFKGALELSRHSLELEKCLGQRQGKEPSLTDIVTTQKKFKVTHPDDPVNHINDMLHDIEGKKEREPRRERRRRRKLERKNLYYAALNCNVDDDNGNGVAGSGNDSSDNHDNAGLHNCMNIKHNELSTGSLSLEIPSAIREHTNDIMSASESKEKLSSSSMVAQTTCHNKPVHGNYVTCTLGSGDKNMSNESYKSSESSKAVKIINTPIQLISEEEIARNRLTLEEIRAMDKFQNYTEGEPNDVVYVKNLPNKTTEEDLIALFGSFQSKGKARVVFKLLSGRMKGQAFITFPDTMTARRAVQAVNGYKLQGRPIILSFGKKHGT
ncbi:hypothetical protein BsWGS_18087 [Bradybaena similaris]